MSNIFKLKICFHSGIKTEITSSLPFEDAKEVLTKLMSSGDTVRIDANDGTSCIINTKQIDIVECRKV